MASVFQIVVLYACFIILGMIAVMYAFVGLKKVGDTLRARLCPVSLLVFAIAAAIATSEAQKRGGMQGGTSTLLTLPNAVTNADWRAHGAYEAAFYIPATNWWARMQDGGWIDRLRIFSSGGFQAKGADGGAWTNYPPPFAQKLSLAPEAHWPLLTDTASFFWHGTTPSNTLVMTWQGGLYERSHMNLVNFQVELFNDGSFDYRYDGHDEHFAASLPFDLDGDGLENSVDPDPLTAGPDAHGTNAEWYNTVCSNVFSAASWREGVNSNAYYFVDVVVERGPTPIYFTGDRDSRLGNPVVVALAGVTNRVPLLIGIDYAVTSDTPFSVSISVDYMYPTVTTNGIADYNVRWPLNFVFTEGIGASNRVYTVTVEPYDPGGILEWDVNVPMRGGSGGDCDCVYCSGNLAYFTCSSTCTCSGCCRARGRYIFEVAEFLVEGGECRCGFDDPPPDNPPNSHDPTDAPSLTITFSEPAVIFENAYEDSPGVMKPRRSTRVRLTIDAYGGPNGGSLWLTGENFGKLVAVDEGVVLPYSQELAAGTSYHASGVYEGMAASVSASDVAVSGSLMPNVQGAEITSLSQLTSLRMNLQTVREAPNNSSLYRHTQGIGEMILLNYQPSCEVSLDLADAIESGSESPRLITWGISNVEHRLSVVLSDVRYTPTIKVLKPTSIEGENVQSQTFGLSAGVAGGLALVQRYRVHPLNVSFEGLSIEEVPCDEEIPPEGYFVYTSTNVFHRSHTRAAHAGIWVPVYSGNVIGGPGSFDKAGFSGALPRRTPEGVPTDDPSYGWCFGGSLTWKIPFGWNKQPHSSLADPVGCFAEETRQTFRISEGGDFRMEKLGHYAERKLDGRVFVDGNEDDGILNNN